MTDTPNASTGTEVHLYYCDADRLARDSLAPGFQQLLDSNVISALRDRCVSAEEPNATLDTVPRGSGVIAVVLLSPDFVASGGCLHNGIQAALEDDLDGTALLTLVLHPLDSPDATASRLVERAVGSTPLSEGEDSAHIVQGLFRSIHHKCTQISAPVHPAGDAPSETIKLGSRKTPRHTDESTRGKKLRSREADPVPERIGRKFKVKRVLGEGAFGRVYLAEDEELRRSVAIKMPHRRRIEKPDDVEAYIKEAQMVAQLDHPGIVPVHEVGRDAEQVYVVSKLIEGKNLAEVLRQSRPSYVQTARLLATVADALHHAHGQNLVHRDIKPANILVDNDGRPYVADFGLAIREEEIGERLRMAGTPAYMSPEQARGEGHNIDPRSDVFSLGVVLYELLTGEQPFLRSRRESVHAVLARISKSDVRPPRQRDASIPRELERICLKAMANRRTERYSIAKDLADDLWQFLEDVEDPASIIEARESDGGSWGTRSRHSRSAGSRRDSERASGSRRTSSGARSSGRHHSRSSSSRHSDGARSTDEFELHSTIQNSDAVAEEIKIIPKGLRAFDQADADFFLALLPGPRDRYEIPESIRFWQRKIEDDHAQDPFRIGVVYGPSGCGKTSLVRAGLLPLLGGFVHLAVLDATAEGTENALTQHIRQLCPSAPPDADLPETIAWIRRGRGFPAEDKLLIVIDQFEQWLQADAGSDELLNALRQCNGQRVQCLLLVRDDFIMGIHRFMKDVEEPIREGINAAAVELFDSLHARAVLRSFGAAYGRLPEQDEALTLEQTKFLDGAIDELSADNHVAPVHLALLADMCKGREWKLETLKTFGGTRGVGEAFLQETFETRLQHQFHQEAARSALKSLLPLPGSRIRDKHQSRAQLAIAAGYDEESAEFAELIGILDRETRLITPVEASTPKLIDGGTTAEQPTDSSVSQAYQLTHDYLVPSLREWLTRKQKETARGRAQLRLEELSLLWNDKPETRRLPGVFEWTTIQYRTRHADWSPPERKMMSAATRRVLAKAVLVVTLLIATVLGIQYRATQLRTERLRSEVEKLATAMMSQVPGIISELGATPSLSSSLLWKAYPTYSENDLGKLNTSLALLVTDSENEQGAQLLAHVYERLQYANPSEVRAIVQSLASRQQPLLDLVRANFVPGTQETLPLASVLAAYDRQSEWTDAMARLVAQQLVDEPTDSAGGWRENLDPVRSRLRGPLLDILLSLDPTDPRQLPQRIVAGDLLAAFAPDRTEDRISFLVRLIPDSSEPDQFNRIVRFLVPDAGAAMQALEAKLKEFDESLETADSLTAREAIRRRQSYAVAAILQLGGTKDIWHRFQYSEDSTLRSLLIENLASFGVDVSVVVDGLENEQQDVSIRRALCLALAGYTKTAFRDEQIRQLAATFASYKRHPDAGLHAAADFVSRVWMARNMIPRPAEPSPGERPPRSQENALKELEELSATWYHSKTGVEMIAVRPVPFEIGSPATDPEREGGSEGTYEAQHKIEIPRSFAVAAKEVTVIEFVMAWREFWPQHPEFHEFLQTEQGNVNVPINRLSPSTVKLNYSPDQYCPVNGVNWFQAAAFCNWLSKKEGIPRAEWCYDPDQRFEDQMTLPPDYLRRTGYRLPTEAEWEYVCRAGSTTSRFYGEGTSLLPSYAWFLSNSDQKSHPVGILKPNDFGFFDILGNIEEWCQDEVRSFLVERPVDSESDTLTVDNQFNRIHRGGAFEYVAQRVRSTARDRSDPDFGYYQLGFRVARTLPEQVEPPQ